jgi:hypothetical protein
MKVSMTKITETYEAFSKEEELSVNLINNILSAMDEELDSDAVIERAALYSSTIETISTTFESAFSSSTTDWIEMFSSSSSAVSKAYSSVSSTFRKEAGTLVVKIISVIKEEYESSSSSSPYDSGSLISKIVTEIETILSSSTILTDSSSFSAGMLIVDVTKGITESIMKSTTTADSGRVMVASMESLNTDIAKSEESSTSADKVDQAGLFTKVATVIMEQFDKSSSVSPSTLMLEVSKTVNEELGSTVSEETETIKLYGNNLKAIFSIFKDLSSLTEKEEKEAKSIIRTIMVFSNTISSSVDAGDIVVATVTALVAFSEGSAFKTPGVQTTMDVLTVVLKENIDNSYPSSGEGKLVLKSVRRALKKIL